MAAFELVFLLTLSTKALVCLILLVELDKFYYESTIFRINLQSHYVDILFCQWLRAGISTYFSIMVVSQIPVGGLGGYDTRIEYD